MADNSDDTGCVLLLLVGGAFLFFSSLGPSDEEQMVADELGVSTDQAVELLDPYGNPEDAIDDYRDPFDEDAAREAAGRELAYEGYDYSYGCMVDCSGHEAGWQWRADNGYSTPGYSNSFDEGGRAFDDALEERVDEMRDAYETGEYVDY